MPSIVSSASRGNDIKQKWDTIALEALIQEIDDYFCSQEERGIKKITLLPSSTGRKIWTAAYQIFLAQQPAKSALQLTLI